MKIEQFLAHHGIVRNPFADEDAQADPVFKEHCLATTTHPAWDKIYGDPAEPSTSIVFGEKGAGKTALRLQIVRHLEQYNREHPDRKVFVIEYDDLNPFLDRFREKLPARHQREDRVLGEWKLWDHMDAILSLGVTRLVDMVLGERPAPTASATAAEAAARQQLNVRELDHYQVRDLLLLAAIYDQSPHEAFTRRWGRLRRKLRYRTWTGRRDLALGLAVTLATLGVIAGSENWHWLGTPWPYLIVAAGWSYWLWRAARWFWFSSGIVRQLRVVKHEPNALRRVLMKFRHADIAGQPLPNRPRTDDRYELLQKFQGVLQSLGYTGIVVVVDRVDEPHLINGSAERMRALIWPLLDNKFLKHPGLGIKLLLPVELSYFMEREERDFYQRARLDKQNLVPSLQWSGEALYDLANVRIQACAAEGKSPTLRDLFDPSISDQRLIDSLRQLRVPRHLFKFMYRLFVAHCNAHTEEKPAWKISSEMFETTLALYQRDQDAMDRGMAAG